MKAFYTAHGRTVYIRLEINGIALGNISCHIDQFSYVRSRIQGEWIEEGF